MKPLWRVKNAMHANGGGIILMASGNGLLGMADNAFVK
jgi:hypothetical protein